MTTEAYTHTDSMTEAFGNTTDDSVNEDTTTLATYDGGMQQYTLYDVTIGINKYYLWAIFAIGFPGNLLSLLTILRMPTVSSSKMHVAMLAIIDNCAIVSKVLFHQLTEHKISLGDAGCKVRWTLFLFTILTIFNVPWILSLFIILTIFKVRRILSLFIILTIFKVPWILSFFIILTIFKVPWILCVHQCYLCSFLPQY